MEDAIQKADYYEDENRRSCSKMMSKVCRFFNKYFCEGQKLSDSQIVAEKCLEPGAPLRQRLLVNHRRLIGILIPFAAFQTVWWCLAIKHDYFALFPERWILTVTMIFGAMVGGATSEGGGAIAFPVMTLALGIAPTVARDFSIMIQSCGLTAASFTILFMRIKLEWHSIIFCNFGALFGLVFGLEYVDALLTPAVKKLAFVSVWFSFAFALFLLNRQYKRTTYDSIPKFGIWQAFVLISTGIAGGVFSAVTGSGLDICSFSMLTLLFRVNEKIATPTSILLMAFNSCCGVFWRQFMTDGGAEAESWSYLAVCVPIVVFFAPVGSFLSSHFHRQVLAFLIYFLDTIALITALVVIPMTWQHWLLCGGLIVGGLMFFFVISKFGEKIVEGQKKLNARDPESYEFESV